jgi:peptide deformylase
VVAFVLLAACKPSANVDQAPSASSASMPPKAATMPTTSSSTIVQTGATVLRTRAREVPPETITTAPFQALIERMKQAMRAAPGVGLAAPQIGVDQRVIVLEDRAELMSGLAEVERTERERTPLPLRVIVNPVLQFVDRQGQLHAQFDARHEDAKAFETRTFFEGCLSVSGYAALVERAREVQVAGLDEKGNPLSFRVSGWPARILQHEVDHLDGTLYIDRMETRSFGTGPQVKQLYGGKPMSEVRRMLDGLR